MEKNCETCGLGYCQRSPDPAKECDYWQPKEASTVLTAEQQADSICRHPKELNWIHTTLCKEQDAHTRHEINEWLKEWWVKYGCEPPSHDSVMAFNQILTKLKE